MFVIEKLCGYGEATLNGWDVFLEADREVEQNSKQQAGLLIMGLSFCAAL